MSMDDRTRIRPGGSETGVGTQLSGIYELDERIASGGMGEVYRGHNIQTGDLVAIKIVLPEFARDQTILSLFRKEASILNHLSHEAVVRYHVFTVDPVIGRPYLAMEYVDGQSLFDVLRQGPMAPDDALRLCHRLASGLSAVHRAGAIHRDLSPDNVILPGGDVERAKIIDFGIARSAHVGGETLIGGRFAGKYNYVSPEQLGLYGGEVSERSDIYSLGLVLAAALRGRPLDMTGSQVDVVEKRRVVPDLAGMEGAMRPIIEAMLQPDPQKRPASMAEIVRMCRQAADVEAEWDEETLAAKPWTGLGRRDRTEDGSSGEDRQARFVEHVRPAYLSRPKPPPAKPSSRPKRRQGMPGAAIGGIVLVLAAAAGAGAYFAGVLPWGSEPGISDQGQAKLVPQRSPMQQEMASAGPTAIAPSPHPTPGLAPRPSQTSSPEPAKNESAEGQAEAARPASAPPADQPRETAPAGKATGSAAPATGLPASEIIKQFLDQARKNSAAKTEKAQQAAPAPQTPAAEPRQNTVAAAAPPPADRAKPAPAPPQTDGTSASSQNAQSAIEKQLPGWTKLPPLPEQRPNAAEQPPDTAMTAAKEESTSSSTAPETSAQTSPPTPQPGVEASTEPPPAGQAGEPASRTPEGAKPSSPPEQTPVTEPAAAPEPTAAFPQAKPPPPLPAPTTTPAEAPARNQVRPPKVSATAGQDFEHSAALPSRPAATPPPAPAAREPAPAPSQPPIGSAQSAKPASGGENGDVVAMNVPRPPVPPPTATSPLAQTVSWLRAYPGGDCFYAVPDDTTGEPLGIIGFGTTSDPFVAMMKAFKSRFGSEPDVQVRLISPAQCEVTRFMRGFAVPTGDIQTLTLDRTSVPNGSPISGVLKTQGGLRSNLLLIDHDGMTYNLDRLLIVSGDTARFNARIELDPASRARGKPMPEIVLAITGSVDLRSASTLQAAPASEVLPKIREEIRQSGKEFSTTAKYFQLGG